MKRALVCLLVCGCYSPSIQDRQFTCEKSDSCPSGFVCLCHECRKAGTQATCGSDGGTPDLASQDLSVSDLSASQDLAAEDLRMADLRPAVGGCAAASRSAEDPGRAKAALCPAAWLVPGINTGTTPCGRTVANNGMSGGTQCAIEDNCAAGWHVCRGDADLTASGFNSSDCAALDNAGALWITRQQGQPPAPSPSPGPPYCMSGVDHSVFGCGSLMNAPPPPLTNCTVVRRVLTDPPDTVDDCSNASSGAFKCGTSGGLESNNVYKPDRTVRGGVICCHD